MDLEKKKQRLKKITSELKKTNANIADEKQKTFLGWKKTLPLN